MREQILINTACNSSINNLTASSVFSLFDLLHSSGLDVLLPQKFASSKAEELSISTSVIFLGQRSTLPYSVCCVLKCGCLRPSKVAWYCYFENSFLLALTIN